MSYRTLDLEPGAQAPGAARRELRHWLSEDGVTGLEDRVLLVASELVTNAALHAGTRLQLSYRADSSTVEIGVLDGAPGGLRLPAAPGAEALPGAGSRLLAVGGRGLGIVRAIADQWGVTEAAGGKRVWARWSRIDLPTALP